MSHVPEAAAASLSPPYLKCAGRQWRAGCAGARQGLVLLPTHVPLAALVAEVQLDLAPLLRET